MPRLEPFQGLRYAPSAGPLGRLIAPPYDVVGPTERSELAARSPYNAVHLELPEPDPAAGLDRYRAAAALLSSWQHDGHLEADGLPALYPYRTTTPGGRSSTGVIGALAIGDDVLPHEQTLPKPRSDRLELLRATGANLSPIWGLSLTRGLTTLIEPRGDPVADVVDDEGVRHQLWVMADPLVHRAVQQALDESPLVVADGHHRYETAKAFRDEARAANADRPGPYDAVMALVVELSADQLSVGPIHRLVTGIDPALDVASSIGRWFDPVAMDADPDTAADELVSSGQLGLVTPAGTWRLVPRSGAAAAAGTDLDSGLVDRAIADLPGAAIAHEGSWRALVAAVRDGGAQVGFVLRPVTVDQIAERASTGRRMPPKTTYFVPKPRSGLVYRLVGSATKA